MSVEAMAVVLHHSRAKGTARLVLLGIANHDGDGGAWPAVATLAKYAGGIDRRGVQRALDKLVSLGEVRRHVQAGGMADVADHERPNRYDVLVVCPPWCDRTAQHRDVRHRQRGLWTDPAVQTPPGGAGTAGGAVQTPPGPAVQAPPKPSTEPADDTGSASTTDRRREPCGVCGLARWACEARSETNGHTFEARGRSASDG